MLFLFSSLTSKGTEVSFYKASPPPHAVAFFFSEHGQKVSWWQPDPQPLIYNCWYTVYCVLRHDSSALALWVTSEFRAVVAIKDKTPTLVARSSSRLPQLDLMCSPCDVQGCPQNDWVKGAGSSQWKTTPGRCFIIYECRTSVKQTYWGLRDEGFHLRSKGDFFLTHHEAKWETRTLVDQS